MNTAINWGIAATILLGSAAGLWWMCRKETASRRPPSGYRIWDATERKWVAAEPAVPFQAAADMRPGSDAAALDWLELTFAMPEFQRGADRLLDDIHNNQQKEADDA